MKDSEAAMAAVAEEGTRTEETIAEMIATQEAAVLPEETGFKRNETTHLRLDPGPHAEEEMINNVQDRQATATNQQETAVLKAIVQITRPTIPRLSEPACDNDWS